MTDGEWGAFHGLSEATDEKFIHHLKISVCRFKKFWGITFLNGFNKPFFYRWKKTCLDVTSDEDSDYKFCGCRICAHKKEVSMLLFFTHTNLTSTKLLSPSLSSMHLSHPGRYSSTCKKKELLKTNSTYYMCD